MNRRTALLGVGGSALFPLPVLAQDGTVPEELEARIATLEERVAVIEQRLDALAAGEVPEPTQQAEQQSQATSGDVIQLSGSGTTMTELVPMETGLYRVEAKVTVANGFGDYFDLTVAGSNDWDDQIFFQFFEGNGEYEISTSWEAKQDGEYAFQVDCTSAWELTFEAM